MSQRRLILWLHLLFALSGAAGLGLQLTWVRRLAFGLGHEIPAAYGVITTFFLGIALGSWLVERFRPKSLHAGTVCAGLEFILGAWALGTVWLIPVLTDLLAKEVPATVDWKTHWVVCFIAPALALLPATVAMGATLPALERWLDGLKKDGLRVAPLYAANTFGAIIGVIGSVWGLQPRLGLRNTTFVFAALNIACAVGFLILRKGSSESCAREQPVASVADRHGNGSSGRGVPGPWRLACLLFLTGFVGIGFEVLGVRLLGQSLENTVYTYASVLAVYLLGTALGAASRNRLFPNPHSSLPALLIGLSLSLSLGGYLLLGTPAWHPKVRALLGDGAGAVLASEALMAALIFFIPTFLMGALFSCLTQLSRNQTGQLGRALAWNTLGGCLAPAVVGLACLPWIGSRWTLALLAVAYLALLPRFSGWVRWGALVAFLPLVLPPWHLHLQRVPTGAQLHSVREGPSETIAVIEYSDGSRALRANNRFTMGGTASASAERRHGQIPLLLHPAPKKALFLGVGTGISFASLDTHPGLEADGVELVPEIADALEEFAPFNAFGNELRVHVADARRFTRSSKNQYDVVIADLFHPARDGAGSLYTREQFQAVRSRLPTNGVFCQWLPLFQLDLPTFRVITRTFVEVFPHSHAFLLRYNADTPVLGLVGSRRPLQFDTGYFERRTQDSRLREQLKPLVLNDPIQFFGTWFADAEWLKKISAGARINTDDKPVVLFQAPKTLTGKPQPGHALLSTLLDTPRPLPDSLFDAAAREAGRDWLDRLVRFQKARDLYLRGLIADTSGPGRSSEAEAAFLESARLSRDFTSGYSQILARASAQAKSNPGSARQLLNQLIEARPDRPVARELKDRLGL